MDALTTWRLITAACVYHVTTGDEGVRSLESRALLVRKVAFFLRQLEGHGGAPQQP